jgi:hypothetical protein
MGRYACKFPGCTYTKPYGTNFAWRGYCPEHSVAARPCVIDDCKNMVASWNRSGCCHEHRALRHKLRP